MFSFLSFRPFSQPAAYITQNATSPLSDIYIGRFFLDYLQVPPFNFYIEILYLGVSTLCYFTLLLHYNTEQKYCILYSVTLI